MFRDLDIDNCNKIDNKYNYTYTIAKNGIMDRFKELAAFVAVADAGAFNAAARKINLSPSVVTRVINALEERLGVRLFTRTTRKVVLTEAGEGFYEDAGRILEALNEAEAHASGAHQQPRGQLTVTAPVLFGQLYLVPIINEFIEDYPEIEANVLFLDRIVNLLDEGIDIALRIGALPDSNLFVRQVGHVRLVTVASQKYLEQYGVPQDPRELVDHRIVNGINLSARSNWQFSLDGHRVNARINPRLTVNTAMSAIDAAVAGGGITRVLSYQLTDKLRSGELVEILSDWEDREMPVQLVYPEGRRAPAKSRAFVELASSRLRERAATFAAM